MRRRVALLGMLVLSPLPCWAEDLPAPSYAIRQDEPSTGTHVKRHVFDAGLPINLRWDQLSLQDRRTVRSQYEALPETDEPPFPADGLKAIYGPIAKLQARRQAEGSLLLIATVSASGDVEKVEAVGAPDEKLTRAAAQILALTKFKPARCAGQPCAMEFPVRVGFTVVDGRP